jgi:long-chain acyl-CoA synthetase
MEDVEKIWLKNYADQTAAEINPDTYSSLVDLLEDSCNRYADLPAFYNMGVTLTFRQIDEYAQAFASYLQNTLKLVKGDRVAIMLPNLLQYPIAMFGILRAGLIVVNINPLYTATELKHQLIDCAAETILVLSNFAHTVQEVLNETQLKNVIVTNVGDLFSVPKALFIHVFLKYIKKKIPAWTIPNFIPFKHMLSEGKKVAFQRVVLTTDDIAFLQYTGGTTGVSKGAILTHRNIQANIQQAEAWFAPIFEPGKEIIITALPLYHIFSLTANCLFLMKIGGLNVLITNARDIDLLVTEMGKFKFTVITGVNTLFNALLKNQNFPKLDFSRLKLTLGGGMAVVKAVAEKWHIVTGHPLVEAYGLTETSPCVSINVAELKEYNGTVGLPVSSTDICIFDEDGKELGVGQSGELGIKGPQVMRGYWQNPIETQKVFTKDGWLLTGDIAMLDEHGFLKILERKKDMILVSGFNVYPNEIEDVLMGMHGIAEAAVIAVPDENSGEVPKAFVVKEDQSLTAEQILKYCRTKLTGYKIPKKVVFCQELPKTNVGKVLRRALRDLQ